MKARLFALALIAMVALGSACSSYRTCATYSKNTTPAVAEKPTAKPM